MSGAASSSDAANQSDESQPQVTYTEPSFVSTSINHPRLSRTDSASIRKSLVSYDQYRKEITARALQLAVVDSTTTEPVRPVNLVYCCDPEWIESIVDLQLIPNLSDPNMLTDSMLREFLEERAEMKKTTVSLSTLNSIVEKELRMDMRDPSAPMRMENLFAGYLSLLRRNGLKWVTESRPKIAVAQVISAVRPKWFRQKLESNIEFSHSELKSDFNAFFKHAMKLAQSFEDLDNGPTSTIRSRKGDGRENMSQKSKTSNGGSIDETRKPRSRRPPPPCPHPPCSEKGLRHWVDDCENSTDQEKRDMKAAFAAQKAADGPSRSTRSQKNKAGNREFTSRNKGTVNRIRPQSGSKPTPSCLITVSDGTTSLDGTGRCDDGSDDSIVSASLAERAALKGIGKISAIKKTFLSVALKSDSKPQSFAFSRAWTAPRTVLHLASGSLALVNITYLVADNDLACEELLIGRPVLQHLRVDTETLLDNNRFALNGADCSDVGNPTVDSEQGYVSRLMVARLQKISDVNHGFQQPSPPANRPRVHYHAARHEQDPFPDPSLLDPIDSDQHEDVKNAVNGMVEQARQHGLDDQQVAKLQHILDQNMNVFRVSLSAGPPANIRPLKIDLVPDAKPVRVRLRNYSQEQRKFLEKFVNDLIRTGMVYANPTSPWASAPLIVPKPGPARFRFTVDLRPVNKYTVRHQFPMPNIEQELLKLAGSKFFATFDLSHGYWQFPLHEESQALQSFITPDGIFSPTRVLHGTTNATTHLQSVLAEIFPKDLRQLLLYWLDDILLHNQTVDGLLEGIEKLLKLCQQYSIRLHPKKCILFSTSIRWCDRIISASGVRYDPMQLEGLLHMEPQSNGAHLQQFLCALQWVKMSIPDFSNLIHPLHNFLEKVYAKAGKRTKSAVARVNLAALDWSEEETKSFRACKAALSNSVTLSHRDEGQRLCVYTDASDTIWSGIITQVPHADLTKPHDEQRHSPLAFCSGFFNTTQLGWSVMEKEAFAIFATLEGMHWIVAISAGFDLFTDHNNLIFLFDPLSIIPDLSQPSVRKVLRWAVKLSVYNYTCFHIKGADNVWADMLTRWAAPPTVRRLVKVPPLSSTSHEGFCWPKPEEIRAQQALNENSRPQDVQKKDGLWRFADGAVWIPDSAETLQLRLCIIAHTGPAGQRGKTSTLKTLRQHYAWTSQQEDIQAFVRACIHCISTTGGNKVPRPFGPAVHGTAPNDLLQFDFLEIGPSRSGEKYVLMLRDDHSDYKWFFACSSTSAENTAQAIVDWCAAFAVPNGLMSDGPTHFRNETVRLLSKALRVPHHFTLPYTPWSNGAVERLGKEVLRTFRALTSELQMDFIEWTDLLPIVQSALNNAPSPQRMNVAPVTAFLGMEPTPPIASFLRSVTQKPTSISSVILERCINTAELQKRCADLHPLVQTGLQKNRESSRKKASKGVLPNFVEGDFVLVAREDFHAGEKLALRWRGPRRIIKALSDYVFQVEDLRNGLTEDVHACRLKYYHDSSLDTEAIMSHVLTSETGMPVARLMKLVDTEHGIKVQVRWKGLSVSEDTLEPLERMYQDVPVMLERLLKRKKTPAGLAKKARLQLAL